jgi:dihydroxy-acid dehydratase
VGAPPETAEAGAIALVEEGDIPKRLLRINISDAELAKRRAAMEDKGASAWKPANRNCKFSQALQAYADLTTSASCGTVRAASRIQK